MQPPAVKPEPTETWHHPASGRRATLEPLAPPHASPLDDAGEACGVTPLILHEYACDAADNPLSLPALMQRLRPGPDAPQPMARALWLTFRGEGRKPRLKARAAHSLAALPHRPGRTVPYGALVAYPNYPWDPRHLAAVNHALNRQARRFIAWKLGRVYALRQEEPAPKDDSGLVLTDYTSPYFGRREARQALFEACAVCLATLDYDGWRRLL